MKCTRLEQYRSRLKQLFLDERMGGCVFDYDEWLERYLIDLMENTDMLDKLEVCYMK